MEKQLAMFGIGMIPVAFGAFFLTAAIKNWNWFFELPKLKHGLLGSLGRQAQRVLYGVAGGFFILLGIALATGVLL